MGGLPACRYELVGILALALQRFSEMVDVRGDHLRIELGMELDAPGARTYDKGLVGLHRTGCKSPGTGREAQHTLEMADVDHTARLQPAQERIVSGFLRQVELDGSKLQPVGVVAHLSTHGVGQQLVPVADTESWNLAFDYPDQPVCGSFAPGMVIADQSVALPSRSTTR